tara:strand:- start:445 stop:765 length:321 start_codon:yes stop_codon:yes gene_type:complete
MKYIIKNRPKGKYFKAPGEGTTKKIKKAHLYDESDILGYHRNTDRFEIIEVPVHKVKTGDTLLLGKVNMIVTSISKEAYIGYIELNGEAVGQISLTKAAFESGVYK